VFGKGFCEEAITRTNLKHYGHGSNTGLSYDFVSVSECFSDGVIEDK